MPSSQSPSRTSTPRGIGAFGLLLGGLLLVAPCLAQENDPNPHSDAWLVPEVTSIQAGTPFTVAVYFEMEEGWHNYWRNAGDSGLPTTVAWELPPGFEAGEIQWPIPERIALYPLVDYGYSDEVALLVEITPPASLRENSRVHLAARVDWLICKEICLPAHAMVEVDLPVRTAPPGPDPEWTDLFASTRRDLPAEVPGLVVRAEVTDQGYLLHVSGLPATDAFPDAVYFFAADQNVLAHADPQVATSGEDGLSLGLVGSPYASAPTSTLRGVLAAEGEISWPGPMAGRGLWVEVPVEGAPPPTPATAPAVAPTPAVAVNQAGLTLTLALLFSFFGGMLLNLMPCVFPVLSLKILGAAGQGDRDRKRIRNQGLFFGLGVELSFLLLALLLLALRAGGSQLGWGFQLQSPLFVAGMAGLFFLIGLNLMGVFEVGASLTRLGRQGADGGGYGEAVASGVLATIIATPCTAPFMGAALGFALTRTTAETLLIFGVLGLGMALPYVVLSLAPGLLEKLPRPGPWMETLKEVMAFPMFATVIWLVWVFGQQTGVGGLTYLLSALLLLSGAGWAIGRWHRTDLASGKLARVFSLAMVILAGALVLGGNAQLPPTFAPQEGWRSYDPQEVSRTVSSGQPVFLDFSAAWCLTCQVNERLVLSSQRVMDAFRDRGVVLYKADWTRQDPVITEALESLGRSGVPVYALYSGDPGAPPRLLPEILTEEIVLTALSELIPVGSP